MRKCGGATLGLTLATVASFLLAPWVAGAQCCGDCNLDGKVTVDEIVKAANRDLNGCQDDGICAACKSSLSTCSTSLSTCNTNLTQTQNTLNSCNSNYTTCSTTLTACNASLATVDAGTAVVGNVLSSKTFSSGSGLGLTGTMPNNGPVNITPGTAPQAIPAGYHSGAGTVAGDASLAAGNIRSGVSIFGVAGNVQQASGNASAADVLGGKTFSNAGGPATGTMPNNRPMTITPGTAAKPIPAGYHNGSGTVAGDANLVAGNILSGVSIFDVTGTAVPARPLKTGQTKCYDPSGASDNEIPCCSGVFCSFQDGGLQTGSARTYVDNGDGTITDLNTGLMWEKKDQSGGIHDWRNRYTFEEAFSVFLGELISAKFAGYSDWRLPNINELHSLADYGRVDPAIDPVFQTKCAAGCTVTTCSCTPQSGFYWSSTTFQNSPHNAWGVLFDDGSVYATGKSTNSYLRAVRGSL